MGKKLRKIKPKKSKKKKIFIILMILVLLGVGGYYGYNYYNSRIAKKKVTVKVLDSIDNYGYSISDRDSALFKTEYDKLKKILNEKEIDEKAYAEEVARLFIIDLYTMSTKINKYDVGGKEFFYNTKVEMYNTKVMDTIYSLLEDDTYGDRKQELPQVKSIETKEVLEDTYRFVEDVTINPNTNTRSCDEGFEVSKNNSNKCVKEVDKAYIVKLTWDYTNDMGYDTEGSVVLAKENENKWSVVEYKPSLTAFDK